MAHEEGADAARFAACLRHLKERSGRSYGQLAQRLHLSTSTLHRYCSGAAVPVDFGPVERLARLCGAPPEERARLHRLWMRADAERGRPGSGASRRDEDSSPSVEQKAGPSGTAVSRPPRRSAGPAPADEAPGPGAGRRWVARSLAALAASAVVTLAGVLAGGSGGGRAVPDGGGVVTAAPAAPTEERRSGAPLTWSVRSHVWRHGCDHRYLIDRDPARVPPPPPEQDAAGWATALGGVHAGETVVEAMVRADRADTPVVIEDVHVRVVRRREPLDRPVFAMSNGCGGALTPAVLRVDLDAERPEVRARDGFDGEDGRRLPATRLPYQVTAEEPLALRIAARAAGCDCAWYVEVRWSSAGRGGLLRLDDSGAPFRTSGAGGRAEYGYDWGEGAWRRR
ncbi:helix-turn-helix domain-containing protein [Streptomyces sp. TR06-5]|uniref:helix-turn-helix domain-containing protein n=1 Tax=Streptomyces sp. TR06-5 TaxID=3385976 RepID=UPI0039A3D08B